MRSRVVVVVLALVVGCWAPFGPPKPATRELSLPIETYRLGNGLRVVLLVDPNAAEAQVTMRYQVGTLDDAPGAEGIAHLAEHLMYQQVRDGQSLFAQLETAATEFNGMTALETTTYFERAPAAKLDELLALEAARLTMRCETITDATFLREREVVRNELRQNQIQLGVTTAVHESLFPAGHPYRHGRDTEQSLGGITREQACAFLDAHYSSDNAVLVVSGNIIAKAVKQSIQRLFGSLARRSIAARRPVAPVTLRSELARKAPIDDATLLLAWPLPADPGRRARVRALGWMLVQQAGEDIKGPVTLTEFGGDRARMIAAIAMPARDETIADVCKILERTLRELPASFSNAKYYDETFDHARQRELHRLFAKFDDGGTRDTHLADHVLAGRDAAGGLASEVQALATMERDDASELAGAELALGRATIVTFEPESSQKLGQPTKLDAPTHHTDQRRHVHDPAAAHQPAARLGVSSPLARAKTRTLPNGIKVLLLPLSSVPTVEVRLVFAVGTGDELAHQRGAALVAGHLLGGNAEDWVQLNKFYSVGAQIEREVGFDHTTFKARGLERHFDVILTGLELFVRNGGYQAVEETLVRLRGALKIDPKEVAVDRTWRGSMFGHDHPYTVAGAWSQLDASQLDTGTVRTFRSVHYRPDALTVVISGGFDPRVADQWIDHAFSTWTADASPRRPSATAKLSAQSVAVPDDTSLVRIKVALPANHLSRASALILTEMLEDAISDVRHQLGASYGLHAALSDARLSSRIQIDGYVDATRARDAIVLVRDRLRAFRNDDATASVFVRARQRVAARLLSIVTSAGALGDLGEASVALERDVDDNVTTSERVRTMTLALIEGDLASLDLSLAAILMRGPTPAVSAAFEALGRKPSIRE